MWRRRGRPIRISDLFRISDFGLRILAGLGVTNLNQDLTAEPAVVLSVGTQMSPDPFQLSGADIVIIVAATLLVVIIGLLAARKVERTTEGYFLASGTMPWWLIGAAFVSTSVSSEQIVGTTGAAYKGGMAIANWEWWCLPTYVLMLVFFIPLYLRNRIMTVPELLNRRFGPAAAASTAV
jgi:SSS family solute:Na+ symporter